MMSKSEIVIAVIFFIIGCAYFIALLHGYTDCAAAGGDYVRGLFWVECVK